MKILFYSETNETLQEIGHRIRNLRISIPLTQEELAEKTNLSVRTISNVETGKDTSFSTIINILRALGKLSNLDLILPEQTIVPSQVRESGMKRERARKKPQDSPASAWKWGDET